jgi:hypothetical protein
MLLGTACEKNFSEIASEISYAARCSSPMTPASCSLSGCSSAAVSARSAACAGARIADANPPCAASSLAMNSASPLAWNASERGFASSRITMSSTGNHSGAAR